MTISAIYVCFEVSRYIDTNVEYDGFMIYRPNKNGLKGSEINESA